MRDHTAGFCPARVTGTTSMPPRAQAADGRRYSASRRTACIIQPVPVCHSYMWCPVQEGRGKLQQAEKHYTLDGHVSKHSDILLFQSALYRCGLSTPQRWSKLWAGQQYLPNSHSRKHSDILLF